MSDQDEVMRLSAEIVNRWSGPLNDMRRDLRKLSDDVKGTHAAGAAHVKKHSEAVTGLRKEFARLDEHVKSTSIQTMAAFGVGALSIASAVSAVKDAVFGFADSTRQMKYLGSATGMTVQQLREFEALARRLNMSPDAMNQGFRNFAQSMHDIRRQVPGEIEELNRTLQTGGLNQFVRGLTNLPIAEAFSRAVGKLYTIRDPQEKRQYLRFLGIPENLADVPVAELRRMMQDIRKNIGVAGPDAEKSAEQFIRAIDRMNEAVDRLKLSIGTDLAKAFATATDEIRNFVEENRNGLVGVLGKAGPEIMRTLRDVREIAIEIKKLRSGDLSPITPHIIPGSPLDRLWPDTDKAKKLGAPFWNPFSGGGDYSVPPVLSPMAYHPGAGGLRSGGGFTMLGAGTSSGSPEDVIAKGTHIGVLQALREFRYEMEGDAGAGGGGSGTGRGLSLAAYHPSGSAGMPGGFAAHRFTSGGSSRQFSIGDIHDALTGGGDDGTGSASIASARARFAQELQDPDKRLQFMGMMLAEGGGSGIMPQADAESAMNRALFSHKTLMQILHSGFYGPIKRGMLPSFMAKVKSNPALMARLSAYIDKALGGSDIIKGHTDQGSLALGDPGAAWENAHSRVRIGTEIFGDWLFGHGTSHWREAFERMAHGGGDAGQGHGLTGYITAPGGPYGGLHGAALRAHFGYRGHGGQLGRQGSLQGGRLEGGNAKIHVLFANAPKGTRTKVASSGFKEVKISRGPTMKANES